MQLCPMLAGAFTMAPVVERVNGAQQIQLLYCPAIVYWAGSYMWDMFTHLLVCLAALAIFAAFGDEVHSTFSTCESQCWHASVSQPKARVSS
jgi:hypothetical protein